MSIQSTIGSTPSLRDFGIEAEKDEAVALKKDGLQAQPAKLGFFGRIMQWIRRENPARINSDTKAAFVAAITQRFGHLAAGAALAKTGFHAGNDQPLTSREIKMAIRHGWDATGGAQALKGAMKELVNMQAETKQLTDKVTQLNKHVTRLRSAKDTRLGVVQAKLAETQQLLAEARGRVAGQTARVGQLASEAPAAAEGVAARPEARTAASTQGRTDRAQQRALLAQSKLGHDSGVQEHLQKARTSAERSQFQTSNMIHSEWAELEAAFGPLGTEEAPQDAQWAALQADMNDTFAKVDAFSAALARPIR